MLNPRLEQILPRLFWPVLVLSLLSGLAGQALLAFRPEAFTAHFLRNPVVLAAVHLTSLGWLATLFLGVGVQALSVLLHRPKAGAVLSAAGLGLFFSGALALVAFLAGRRDATVLTVALAGLGGGYTVLVGQAWRLSSGTEVRTAAWHGLRAAYAYLGALLALGSAMAYGLLEPVLPQTPMATLNLHVHVALAGFAGLAIFAILPKLLRLFLGAKGYPVWPARLSTLGVHAGLLSHLAGWLSGAELPVKIASVFFSVAALLFVVQIILLARAATKPRFNSSFAAQSTALVWLLAAAGMDLELAWRGGPWQWAAAACYLALFGWIGGTILGTAQRIVGVLAWFQRFDGDSMTRKVPTAWDLVDPRLAWAAPCLHTAATVLGAAGLVWGQVPLLRASGFLGAAALLCTMALVPMGLRRGRAEDFLKIV